MLMYYGRLFIKVTCYLFWKKKIPCKADKSIAKKCSAFYNKRYILYPKLNFLKKKKLLTTRLKNINSLTFFSIYQNTRAKRSSSSTTNKKGKKKKKKKKEKKKISRGRDSCVAYSKMAVDHHSLRQNVVTPN